MSAIAIAIAIVSVIAMLLAATRGECDTVSYRSLQGKQRKTIILCTSLWSRIEVLPVLFMVSSIGAYYFISQNYPIQP